MKGLDLVRGQFYSQFHRFLFVLLCLILIFPGYSFASGNASEAEYSTAKGTLRISKSDKFFDSKPKRKIIPYKVYVPENNQILSSGRRITYPLDVIILSHGAGQNCEIATGFRSFGGYIDGLATYWAKNGYIVVAPTHRKLLHGIFGRKYWEPKTRKNAALYAISDFMAAKHLHPQEFFTNRVRDLAYVRSHLDEILDEPKWRGCFNESSKVGIVGHSFGGVTTLAAGGVPVPVGNKDKAENLCLESQIPFRPRDPFRRNVRDGSFVNADAYMLLCASGEGIPSENLWLIDPSESEMTGRDYIQKPLMVLTGTKDMVDEDHYYDPVVLAYAINDKPAYGTVVEKANHITPITEFGGVPSWFVAYDFLTDLMNGTSRDDKRPPWKTRKDIFSLDRDKSIFNIKQRQLLKRDSQIFEDALWELYQHLPKHEIEPGKSMKSLTSKWKKEELERFEEFKKYTLAFWDAFVSPKYDDPGDPNTGYAFLSHPKYWHESAPLINKFADNPPTKSDRFYDSYQVPLAQLMDNGNVMLLKAGATIIPHADPIPPPYCVSRFEVKHGDKIVAVLDENTGSLYVSGHVKNRQSSPSTDHEIEYEIKRCKDGTISRQIIIDSVGNLIIRGRIFTCHGEYIPDCE